jgi:outer membrane autotransporter protein
VTTIGPNAEGLYANARFAAGNASVTLGGGSVFTNGLDSDGIVALSQDGGNATATIAGGRLETLSVASTGVVVQTNSGGNATVNMLDGSIETSGGLGSFGISATTQGGGDVLVNQAGGSITTTGSVSSGIYANAFTTGNVIVLQGSGAVVDVSGASSDGIYAQSVGGTYSVDISGAVAGGTNGVASVAAIRTLGALGGTIDVRATGVADGSASGIGIIDGAGAVTLTSAGSIVGEVQTNEGDDTVNLLAGSSAGGDIVLGAGDDRVNANGGIGQAIFGNDGNDTIMLAGTTLTGNIQGEEGDDVFVWLSGTTAAFLGGSGSDTAVVTAAEYNGTQLLDGGDDVSTADGMIDTLTFTNVSATATGANLVNWERIVVDSGTTLGFSDSALTTSADPDMGLFINDGGTLLGSIPGGLFTVNGNATNAGLLSLGDGVAGDRFVVAGNYAGAGGTVVLDTALGTDTSPTDQLVVNGDTSGSSRLRVLNAGGSGGLTTNGIRVVHVAGVSSGSFSLIGDFVFQGDQAVVGGAYAYRLYQNGISTPADGDWYLRSTLIDPVDPPRPHFQPGVPIFEAYPQILLGLNGLPTLQQRVGNRFWSGGGAGVAAQGADADGEPAASEPGATATEGRGFWGRIEGAHTRVDPSVSTSGADYDYNLYKMQAGLDAPLFDNSAGVLIGGLVMNYGQASADVTSVHGDGDIRTDGYGFGGTLTWYGKNGFYLDAQSQLTWYDSDLNSDDLGELADGNNGFGYALSLEGGKRIELPNGLAITPQAQLVYSSVDFETLPRQPRSATLPTSRCGTATACAGAWA